VSLGKYAVVVLAIVVGSMGAVWNALDGGQRLAAAVGAGLASVNTVLAYAFVLWGERRSNTMFLGAVLGGMVGRMGAMLAAVVASVLWLGLPKVPLAVSLLSYFVLFLILELTILHKKTSREAR
jgi:hypothetical protein